ncbi:class I SAM-dependent methyltransferase [Aurantimonas sp. C2-6-R+9]|uniref:class I SAM-dependent methyltransferase n=1 Tax=unclassified Aurantimonas TaxID=2638230 RepID=UPI002E1785C8|nr:class I SAM-dependent methyltransferase [Aurantimonas sp. C2-6-R+9]
MRWRSLLRPRERAFIELRRLAEIRARRDLERVPDLWRLLQEYLQRTESTGCGLIDYHTLYTHVRATAPVEILECGTGASTVVLAAALRENEREGRPRGRVTSMEDHENWYEMARRLLPDELHDYVDLVLSPGEDGAFSLFRGRRYREVPERPYGFVFVDGPSYRTDDGFMTFDLDVLDVISRSEQKVSAVVDARVSTCWVLQQVLGTEKVRFDPARRLGFVAPSTSADMRLVRDDTPSRSFQGSWRLGGTTRLAFTRDAELGRWKR